MKTLYDTCKAVASRNTLNNVPLDSEPFRERKTVVQEIWP